MRKALGEGVNERRYILTVPRRGYRFVAEVRTVPPPNESEGIVGEAVQLPQADLSSRLPDSETRTTPVRRLLIMLAIGAVIVVGTAYVFQTHRDRGKQSVQSIRTIAVLPFKTMGGTADDQYMGAGMADALTAKLSKLSQLRVRPTGSVLRYGKASVNPVSAGQELSVDAVLDGELQRAGNRIRVTVQLISVRDGAAIWADVFEQDFTNIFAVEDSISTGASEHLALLLTEKEKKSLAQHVTQNPEAYQAYMKGRYFWDKNTEEPMRKSVQYFQQAIDLDPNFALAYVGIADAYADLVIQGYIAAPTGLAKVKASALTALQIDPTRPSRTTLWVWWHGVTTGIGRPPRRSSIARPN